MHIAALMKTLQCQQHTTRNLTEFLFTELLPLFQQRFNRSTTAELRDELLSYSIHPRSPIIHSPSSTHHDNRRDFYASGLIHFTCFPSDLKVILDSRSFRTTHRSLVLVLIASNVFPHLLLLISRFNANSSPILCNSSYIL